MLGVEAFVVAGAFDEFVVRVSRSRSRSVLSAAQLASAERFLSDLRFELTSQGPRALRLVQQLLAEADGDPLPSSRSQLTHEAPLQSMLTRVEEAVRAGRILVEVRRTSSLGERAALKLPDLPPLPPSPPRDSSHTFEVRVVDEVGQPLSGVEADFSADGRKTRTSNAAGLAELTDVQTTRADVSLADIEGLARTLEPRWEALRRGKPPQEANLQTATFRGESLGPFPLKAALPNTVVIRPPLGRLCVELWDKTGRTRHVGQTFRIEGPQSFEGKTDELGRITIESVFPGDYSLSLALERFEEGDPDRAVDIHESPLVVLEPGDPQPLVRKVGAVPRVVLARLALFFNTNKSFLLPTALPSVRKLRRLYIESAPCHLLVVGHADTRGDASYNDRLSLTRAKAVIAYLNDDVDAWLAFYGAGVEANQRWGKSEDQQMLRAQPDFASKPRGEPALRWFQRTRNLPLSSEANVPTRRALVESYMALDGASLRDFSRELVATAHGCGESFPVDDVGRELDRAPKDGKRDRKDRRVELFFFDPEFGVTPPPPGDFSRPGSIEYPLWRKRVSEIVELRADDADGPRVVFVELADVHFRSNSAVMSPDGATPPGAQPRAFTSAGLIATALRVNEERPGRRLFVAGHTDTTAGDAHNDELSLLRARLVLSLLEGDRDTFRGIAAERHVAADINHILSWVSRAFPDLPFDCDPGAIGSGVDARSVRRFQARFNQHKVTLGSKAADLGVDGSVGPLTWGAFFDCYELALRRELGESDARVAELRAALSFADEKRKALGFGERFPLEELGVDGFQSVLNRRVEILYFDDGEQPDLERAEVDPETSELYLPGHYVRERVEPRSSAKVKIINLTLSSFDNFRMPGAPFTIRTDEGAVISGAANDDGVVVAKVPFGSRRMKLRVDDLDPSHLSRPRYEAEFEFATYDPPETPLGATQRLRALGVWDGPVVSELGEGVQEALSHFQFLVGLPRTGALDAQTAQLLDRLSRDNGDSA